MKILIPVDGSELALDAVRYALKLRSDGLQASFVLATVQEPGGVYEMLMVPDAQARENLNQTLGAQALVDAEALLTAAGESYECQISSGYPAPMLLEIAENYGCDAIIIGAKGHGTLRSTLLGSVSQAVLHASTIPVTVVKHAADAPH